MQTTRQAVRVKKGARPHLFWAILLPTDDQDFIPKSRFVKLSLSVFAVGEGDLALKYPIYDFYDILVLVRTRLNYEQALLELAQNMKLFCLNSALLGDRGQVSCVFY